MYTSSLRLGAMPTVKLSSKKSDHCVSAPKPNSQLLVMKMTKSSAELAPIQTGCRNGDQYLPKISYRGTKSGLAPCMRSNLFRWRGLRANRKTCISEFLFRFAAFSLLSRHSWAEGLDRAERGATKNSQVELSSINLS
jgi:hypothetical protein